MLCPAHIRGTRWEPVYNEIVQRMRNEAKGLTMNTSQELLIERIATFYVEVRFREEDDTLPPLTMKEHAEFNKNWLDMVREFNKLLLSGQEKLREALVMEIQTILINRLSLIKDPEQRRELRRALQEDFARLGV